jgi:hypothetical protein
MLLFHLYRHTRDFHVVQASRPELLFVGPGAAEDRMSVGIDEPGHQHAATAVHGSEISIPGLQLSPWPDRDNPAIGHRDRGVGENA